MSASVTLGVRTHRVMRKAIRNSPISFKDATKPADLPRPTRRKWLPRLFFPGVLLFLSCHISTSGGSLEAKKQPRHEESKVFRVLDPLGFWGPKIVTAMTLKHLIQENETHYALYYALGSIINAVLNCVIKCMLKHPRPRDERFLYDIKCYRTLGQGYGMPSGHAQNSFFALATYAFFSQKPIEGGIAFLLTCNTCLQRYRYRHHTPIQIVMGAITGLTFAVIAYVIYPWG